MLKENHKLMMKWWDENSTEYEAVFFDIDGTLIAGRHQIPGAAKFLRTLADRKFPYLLLTNDGNHSVEEKSRTLARAGLNVPPQNFVSCSMALRIFVEKNKCHGKKFFVMGDLGKPCFAQKAGLKVERKPSEISSCMGVIVGEGVYDWQKAFSAAINFFTLNPSAPLLVPNPDSYWPNGPNGDIGIGAGGKARFICTILREYGVKLKPLYFGKPYRMIYDFAMRELKEIYPNKYPFSKNKILMVGDSLRSDIKGGNRFGIKTALVLTGITKTSHLKKTEKCLTPDFVFERLA
ncbi:MAG TPA: HAD-IIA family hydrolase [Victivallales bacterium]|nr:HAD-IIA family hydrolase [Victivallales bacterium]